MARAGLTCQQIGAHDTGHLGGPVTVVEQEEDLPAPLRLDAVSRRLADTGVRARPGATGRCRPADGVEAQRRGEVLFLLNHGDRAPRWPVSWAPIC